MSFALRGALIFGASLAGLIALNIRQNGSASHPAPRITEYTQALNLESKADFVAAWRQGTAPRNYKGRTFNAALPGLGVLAPMSSVITHRLLGGIGGGTWVGKSFDADGALGRNRFTDGVRVTMAASVTASAFDGKQALVLDYTGGDSFLFGPVLGMRDEIREVYPGVLLGLGSMASAGGVRNSAPFVLWAAN